MWESLYCVTLLITESLSMASVIGVTLGLLLILLVLVAVITICYNRQKLCFKGIIFPVRTMTIDLFRKLYFTTR